MTHGMGAVHMVPTKLTCCRCSLAYGTPPHVQRGFHDVPLPQRDSSTSVKEVREVFISLCSLTELLASDLEHVYVLKKSRLSVLALTQSLASLAARIDAWEEALPRASRRNIVGGYDLNVPGTSNLRLACLAVRLLIRRLYLDHCKQDPDSGPEEKFHSHVQAQKAAEEVVRLLKVFESRQIADFWLPTSAFIIASATTLLVRCALEIDISRYTSNRKQAIASAHEAIATLCSHRDRYDWDLGEICLAQCQDVVESLIDGVMNTAEGNAAEAIDGLDFDVLGYDRLFPSLWEMFDNDLLG